MLWITVYPGCRRATPRRLPPWAVRAQTPSDCRTTLATWLLNFLVKRLKEKLSSDFWASTTYNYIWRLWTQRMRTKKPSFRECDWNKRKDNTAGWISGSRKYSPPSKSTAKPGKREWCHEIRREHGTVNKVSFWDAPPLELSYQLRGLPGTVGTSPDLSKTWSATFDSLSCKEKGHTVRSWHCGNGCVLGHARWSLMSPFLRQDALLPPCLRCRGRYSEGLDWQLRCSSIITAGKGEPDAFYSAKVITSEAGCPGGRCGRVDWDVWGWDDEAHP